MLLSKIVCYHSIFHMEYENIAKATPLAKEELSLQKLIKVQKWKSNHIFGMKLETVINKLLLYLQIKSQK